MNLPKDPFILLSYINTQLRDTGKNLNDLCEAIDADKNELTSCLMQINYLYNEKKNQFI